MANLKEMADLKEVEPPSCLRSPLFTVGQDSHGNWVVQGRNGTRGGLFIDRNQALRFVRAENGRQSQAVVVVTGVLELDMTRTTDQPSRYPRPATAQSERRVA